MSPHVLEDKKESESRNQVVGGCAFFVSLMVLLPLGVICVFLALTQIRDAEVIAIISFVTTTILGLLFAKIAIRGHLSVLLHEFKHSLVSNFVGNKHKGMKIGRDSGHYEYTYTKNTAHYNALIALAPYITPLFSLMALALALTLWSETVVLAVAVIGFGYGIDLHLNIRDISPIQTDISLIRGGYFVGLLYIFAWNLLILAFILALAFNGPLGVAEIFDTIAGTLARSYLSTSGHSPGE